jgi:hypothetical protein
VTRRARPPAAALAAVLGLALVPGATAHGPAAVAAGYVSTVSALEPNLLGVFANVIGGDARLRLSNYSGEPVVVLGYEGEPFLRFAGKAVYENVRSPSVYLSRKRDPARTRVPAAADADAAPRWRRIARGYSYAWFDHRIHWTHADVPPAVKKAPDQIHLIFRWRVPGRADGTRFAIQGLLGYRPPPRAQDGGGTRRWLLAAAGAGGALVLAVGARRLRRRAP